MLNRYTQMEKDGQLAGDDDKGMEGLPFLEGQLVKAGQMLGDIWLTAWLDAPEGEYLEVNFSNATRQHPSQNERWKSIGLPSRSLERVLKNLWFRPPSPDFGAAVFIFLLRSKRRLVGPTGFEPVTKRL